MTDWTIEWKDGEPVRYTDADGRMYPVYDGFAALLKVSRDDAERATEQRVRAEIDERLRFLRTMQKAGAKVDERHGSDEVRDWRMRIEEAESLRARVEQKGGD